MEQSNFYTMRLSPTNAAQQPPRLVVFVKLLTAPVKVAAQHETSSNFF
jgi:hypothetical protein